MNAKALKTLRRDCRNAAALAEVPMRAHVIPPMHVRMIPDLAAGLNQDGTVKFKPFFYTGTVKNEPMSFRGLYRKLKKEARRVN